jgi:hypothetical protein
VEELGGPQALPVTRDAAYRWTMLARAGTCDAYAAEGVVETPQKRATTTTAAPNSDRSDAAGDSSAAPVEATATAALGRDTCGGGEARDEARREQAAGGLRADDGRLDGGRRE